MAVLVVNCGSSSLKFALVDPNDGHRTLGGLVDRIGTPEASLRTRGVVDRELAVGGVDHDAALDHVLTVLRGAGLDAHVDAVGHRVVHGGERFTAATMIDAEVETALEALADLAPLHNPANLLGIRAARRAFSRLPHVAVFDTAFHQTMAAEAYRYAVPEAWYREHGVRRYGFHGTSHRYVAEEAARRLGHPLASLALLTAHLGNGCSASAIVRGHSVDTTMGLTPLGGVVMGTRSGDIDPSILGHVAGRSSTSLADMLDTLNRKSGLLGLSGVSNDMRTILRARDEGHAGATLAVAVFCHRLAASLLGLCASLPRLDALVFTGGIGEHAAAIRAEVVSRLWPLGLRIDELRNETGGDAIGRIDPDQGPAILVIPTDEELMIARDTRDVVGRSP